LNYAAWNICSDSKALLRDIAVRGALKMQDMKMKDQTARHENAGHENAGHENAGHENVFATLFL